MFILLLFLSLIGEYRIQPRKDTLSFLFLGRHSELLDNSCLPLFSSSSEEGNEYHIFLA